MKTPWIPLTLQLLFTPLAFAQADHNGHGGGAWDCGTKVEMFDYYDGVAKRGFDYHLMSEQKTTAENVHAVISNIMILDFHNGEQVSRTAEALLADLAILEKNPRSLETQITKMNQDPIKILEDSGLNYIRKGCKPVQLVWQQRPQFAEDRWFDIHQETYERMRSTVQRATMILHESVYHLLLDTQKDSTTTRAYLGWVASTELKPTLQSQYVIRIKEAGFTRFGYQWKNGTRLVADIKHAVPGGNSDGVAYFFREAGEKPEFESEPGRSEYWDRPEEGRNREKLIETLFNFIGDAGFLIRLEGDAPQFLLADSSLDDDYGMEISIRSNPVKTGDWVLGRQIKSGTEKSDLVRQGSPEFLYISKVDLQHSISIHEGSDHASLTFKAQNQSFYFDLKLSKKLILLKGSPTLDVYLLGDSLQLSH